MTASLLRRLKPALTPRWVRLTGTGAFVLLACLGIGGMAIFFSNNLFYFLVSMLLGFVAMSGILSEITIRGIELERKLPDSVHAMSPVFVTAEVVNLKKQAPSLCLHVKDDTLGGEAFLMEVAPLSRARQRYQVRFSRRGLHSFGPATVSTTFPFGFFKKWTTFDDSRTFLVLPAVRDLDYLFKSRGLGSGDFRVAFRGEGTNLFSVREYRDGDPSRMIHWKSSARRMELMIKDLEREVTGKATLELLGGFGDRLEAAVTLAASLANALHQRQIRFRVRMGTVESAFDSGPRHLVGVLRLLALYDGAPLESIKPPEKEEHVLRLAARAASETPGRETLAVGPEWDWLLLDPEGQR